MQASQSNNASDLRNPHTQPDATFTRGLPSPFSLPIQAARKYLERQRGDSWQTDAEQSETERRGASQLADELEARNGISRNCGFREESSHERDRRLERSLYEGHSVEAGLSFDGTDEPDALPPMEAGRAYLDESDGAEILFPYSAPGPSPDPEAVRGAILRLARESALRRETERGLAGDSRRTGAGMRVAEPGFDGQETVHPLNFGDVARRVWGGDAALERAVNHSVIGTEGATSLKGTADPIQGVCLEENTGEARGALDILGISDTGVISEAGGSDCDQAEAGGINLQAAIEMGSLEERKTPGMVPMAHSPKVEGIPGSAEQGPALAHDACNLLSALGLYSELLGSPGVLADQYLHYADELKLMAGRSQLLIERLLQVAAARKGEDFAVANKAFSGLDRRTGLDRDGASQIAMEPGGGDESRCVRASVTSDESPNGRATEVAGDAEATSLSCLLMRWGGLLSTLTHGTLEVVFGPHAAIPIPARAEALERILVNLIRNAGAATAEGGAIRIGAGLAVGGEPGEHTEPSDAGPVRTVVLTVDDSGCGMSEAQIRWLLERETSSAEAIAPGSLTAEEESLNEHGRPPHTRRRGLGFQIVRELVAASGGTLLVQSWPGTGTRVEIRWTVAPLAMTGPSLQQLQTYPVEAASTETASVAIHAVSPIAEAKPLPGTAAEGTKVTPGPDGFSETELRAMMLRLHRSGPQERSPLSRRLGSRPVTTSETGRGLGLIKAVAVSEDSDGPGRNNSARSDLAAKGAIAC